MRVGIYIAGWNCASYAYQCLSSLCQQTYHDWVAAVVVDKSDDSTVSECRRALIGENRVEVIVNKDRLHSCANKLTAIQQLALDPGDVLFGLDLDDYLKPIALETVVAAHENGAWVTYGNWEDQNGRVNPHVLWTEATFASMRDRPWFLTAPNTFRVAVFDRIPKGHFYWNDGRGPYQNGFDGSVMFGAVDLAGMNRVKGIADPIYVYNKDKDTSVLRMFPWSHREAVFSEQRAKPVLRRKDTL